MQFLKMLGILIGGTLLILLFVLFGMPEFGPLIGGVCGIFIYRLFRYGDVKAPKTEEERELSERIIDELERWKLEQLSVKMSDLTECRICGHQHFGAELTHLEECQGSAAKFFPHKVSDEPPIDNPWAWWYWQSLGYPPPPDDWDSANYIWDHEVYYSGYSLPQIQRIGLDYWAKNYNHAWALGEKWLAFPDVATDEERRGNRER